MTDAGGREVAEKFAAGQAGRSWATYAKDDRQFRLWLRRDSLSVHYEVGGQELG